MLFYLFALVSLVSALLAVTRRNPVAAAMWLVLMFFGLAGIYVLLEAYFVAAVQVLVYAGAIMVLFLFVIMLLGVDRGGSLRERIRLQRPVGIVLAVGIVLEIIVAVRAGIGLATRVPAEFTANGDGNARALSETLFRSYVFPFEVTSILLIVAAVAAIVLAQRGRTPITGPDAAGGTEA